MRRVRPPGGAGARGSAHWGEEGPPTGVSLGEEGPPTGVRRVRPLGVSLGEEGPPTGVRRVRPLGVSLGEEGPPTGVRGPPTGVWGSAHQGKEPEQKRISLEPGSHSQRRRSQTCVHKACKQVCWVQAAAYAMRN